MRSSYLCLSLVATLCLVIFNLDTSEATFAITLGTAGAAAMPVMLTAAEVTTIAAVGMLAKVGAVTAGILGGRKKRKANIEEKITLEKLVLLEPDDCYKRIFCAASTGR